MTVGKDVSGLFPDVLKNMVGLRLQNNAEISLTLLTANGRPRAKEASLPVSHELRQDSAGACHSGCQHFRQGEYWNVTAWSFSLIALRAIFRTRPTTTH